MEFSIHDVKKIRISELEDNLGQTKVRKIWVESENEGTFELVLFGKEESLVVKGLGKRVLRCPFVKDGATFA